ncbi:O-antigen ligase family protein [Planctomyces sp. SH-PL14]|uniref:O-antigen ligase family protein n=1 Tax=Planctomyces sp. SH-PL14 TaxID=1632864 RepID=UPI00078DC095|nr:O-antigen ligase family protein [Planctomyces sp. SH-PL14]AMV17188.1 O-Antigen ligase [Planctomyces sp. SH-PL14]
MASPLASPGTPSPADSPEGGDALVDWLALGGLVAARWWIPVESTLMGETLPIVQLTLLTALFAAWRWFRESDGLRRWTGLDLLVFALVGAHVLSGLAVLVTGGQKRYALNLLWEWVGTGVIWGMAAQLVDRQGFLTRLLGTLSVAAIVLAGFGVWQNAIVYPELRAMLDDFEQLEKRTDALTAEERTRFRDLQRSLPASYLQGDPSSRMLFSNRVRASQEPLGMFALANSFGGFLLVGGWIAWGRFVETWRSGAARRRLIPWGIGLLLIAVSLILTKARTAWAGGLVGIGVWLVLSGAFQLPRKVWLGGVGGVLGLLVLIAGVGFATGRLDSETVFEAPKSVRYRLEYWQPTLQLLAAKPLLGPGLGDFRSHYLRYKLPQSSEEILDPHNFLLDAWANGGLLALLAVVGIVALSVSRLPRVRDSIAASPEAASFPWWSSLAIGQVGILVAAGVLFLTGSDPVTALAWVIPAWWIAGILLERTASPTIPRSVTAAAWCSLTVHLLGAGGFESPGFSQLWLLLAASFAWPAGGAAPSTVQPPPAVRWGLLGGSLAAVLACLGTGMVPVVSAGAAMRLGQEHLQVERNLAAAQKDFVAAGQADPFDPEPWIQQGFLSEVRWRNGIDDHHFDEAIRQIEEARRRHPHDPFLLRMLGLMWWERYGRSHDPADARKSADALRESVARYPYHAGLLADLARSLGPVDPKEALDVALRAKAQDELNIQYAHWDKCLTDAIRDRVRRQIAAEGKPAESAAGEPPPKSS